MQHDERVWYFNFESLLNNYIFGKELDRGIQQLLHDLRCHRMSREISLEESYEILRCCLCSEIFGTGLTIGDKRWHLWMTPAAGNTRLCRTLLLPGGGGGGGVVQGESLTHSGDERQWRVLGDNSWIFITSDGE